MTRTVLRLCICCSLLLSLHLARAATVDIAFSETGFQPYGGTLTGTLDGILGPDGRLVWGMTYEIGNDDGTLISAGLNFTGPFPGHPDVNVSDGPWTLYYLSPEDFAIQAGSPFEMEADEAGSDGTVDVSTPIGTYQQHSTQPYTVTLVPEPASAMLFALAGCLSLALGACGRLRRRILR